MNSLWQQYLKKILTIDYAEVCFLTFLNLITVAAMIIGRNKVFYSTFISASIVMTIAILLTILTERFSSKIGVKGDIIKVIAMEAVLLFGLPLLPPTMSIVFLILEVLAVIAAQSFALFLFWKAFEIELVELAIFLGLASTFFPPIARRHISSVFAQIKTWSVKVSNTYFSPNAFSVKETEHS